MSIDSIAENKPSPSVRFLKAPYNFIGEYVIPATAVGAGMTLLLNSAFSLADLVGLKPGSMNMEDGLMCSAYAALIVGQTLYHANKPNRDNTYRAPVIDYEESHGQKLLNEIYDTQKESDEQLPPAA